MNDNRSYFSERFAEDYGIEKQDDSGFTVLLVDSILILIDYISNANEGQDFKDFAMSSNKKCDYSGDLKFKDKWRDLEFGVKFYKDNLNFMRWEDCDAPNCTHWSPGVLSRP